MYILEIETKKNIEKVNNPRKVVKEDFIFFHSLKILDDNGHWHHIANISDWEKASKAKKKL